MSKKRVIEPSQPSQETKRPRGENETMMQQQQHHHHHHHHHHHLEPLVSAAVVLRSRHAGSSTTGCTADVLMLPHVLNNVSAFLDHATPAIWSLERACKRDVPDTHVGYRAAMAGHLEILQWLLPRVQLPPSRFATLLRHAVRCGRLEVVRWLHEYQYQARVEMTDMTASYDPGMLVSAIRYGHLAIAKFFVDVGYPLESAQKGDLSFGFCQGGLELLQWLHEHQLAQSTPHWMDKAALVGDLGAVKWIHENLERDTTRSSSVNVSAAVIGTKLDKRLQKRFPEVCSLKGCSASAMDYAAVAGHLDVMQWLHANRTEGCTTRAMDDAAGAGHLDVVQWLHANRTEGCTTRAMDRAAGAGHLNVVRWLHEHRSEGCTTDAMDDAASGDHLDVVQWLHEHRTEGCTINAMDQAATRGHLEIVEWLHEHRTEGCTTDAMDN
ncbi:hypothetical protein PybrP1_005063, partial [[Pythium] brassicae (nom. inval.)]